MSTLGSATVDLKKSLEMNMVDITQIININSRLKYMNRFAQTYGSYETELWKVSTKLWKPTFNATESSSNLYWKLLLTWLLKTNAIMTTITCHSRDNNKTADRAQKMKGIN